MKWFWNRHRPRKMSYAEQMQRENQKAFESQMQSIKDISDIAMKQAHPGGCTFPVRKTVTVDYNLLMRIWGIADRAKWDIEVR